MQLDEMQGVIEVLEKDLGGREWKVDRRGILGGMESNDEAHGLKFKTREDASWSGHLQASTCIHSRGCGNTVAEL